MLGPDVALIMAEFVVAAVAMEVLFPPRVRLIIQGAVALQYPLQK
jgi:hypothetical protein